MNNAHRISWSGPLSSSVDIPSTLDTTAETSLSPCFSLAHTSLLTLEVREAICSAAMYRGCEPVMVRTRYGADTSAIHRRTTKRGSSVRIRPRYTDR